MVSKRVNVIPTFKKKKIENIMNCRPVLLPGVGKTTVRKYTH